MPFVGFRANEEKHSRILGHLESYLKLKQASEEVRRLIELGLDVVDGKYIRREEQIVKPDPSRTSPLPWLSQGVRK